MTPVWSDDIVTLRRALHRIPELGFEERLTSARLQEAVGGVGAIQPIAETGFFVDIGPSEAARTLLLRADMDALPVQEETGLSFASQHAGRMHACGHDAHMASLAVAARLLADCPPEDLRLRLLFQPAEEGQGGAQRCIEEGILDGVDAAFGLHVWSELPVGTVAVNSGGIMAGVIDVEFEVVGRGGHGAMPHQTVDPIVAGSQLVLALQGVVSRQTSPLDPVVLSVGAFHAGEAFNVIPDRAVLRGTIRTFSQQTSEAVEAAVRRTARGVAEATGARIEVRWRLDCIPTVNDARVSAIVGEAASEVPGVEQVLKDYRTTAGEDFGYILDQVPGCYALVGAGGTEPHHSPRFDLDEACLPICTGLHLAVVRAFGAAQPGG